MRFFFAGPPARRRHASAKALQACAARSASASSSFDGAGRAFVDPGFNRGASTTKAFGAGSPSAGQSSHVDHASSRPGGTGAVQCSVPKRGSICGDSAGRRVARCANGAHVAGISVEAGGGGGFAGMSFASAAWKPPRPAHRGQPGAHGTSGGHSSPRNAAVESSTRHFVGSARTRNTSMASSSNGASRHPPATSRRCSLSTPSWGSISAARPSTRSSTSPSSSKSKFSRSTFRSSAESRPSVSPESSLKQARACARTQPTTSAQRATPASVKSTDTANRAPHATESDTPSPDTPATRPAARPLLCANQPVSYVRHAVEQASRRSDDK